ncbi:tricarballylate utilization 4Fe-4S protein TcuB [Bradyrhizobium sp. INPA01-394B]|uniref:Tricarballylate utilization 4Fe-4S protein TcuB n=1 Tax=Bradyrhizobium campsiandrae TaxID=1729892 RepID=A0ABR7UIN0_9BRAD|nr:tricarballylate utilization 4Fe-4S protein TcuB [Bradyrhizobium campsiandrae]MBC9876896.1 tricarballylate utilization 4Fe-4S protein TcuB [Bradyrhizobium campsiandrae]MBC9877043.1 tricarballylate utilization 4Fe-4S protein TcuB [Bradyrhizobium campsiandrae]MBC9983277.1 tricarballylate utilization 4Fe-4S protein TcuB [Bradyrhizobium campsiandrae]
MHGSRILDEADRLMTVCNSCRYCEGLCAVFPAMEMRRAFSDGDLNYLANLCHACGACYVDCQFSPPHEFNVNVPKTLAVARAESYAIYAWPQALSGAFAHNGLVISIVAALSVAAFVFGFAALNDRSVLFGVHAGAGAFYKLMPHNAMAALFSAAFLYAIVALVMSVRTFWRDIATPVGGRADGGSIFQAIRDAGELRYLHGGGVGCYNEDDKPTDRRKLFHHLTFYGFLLCFAATSVATLYHYLLGREAPYPWWDLPVVLGTFGGFGLIVGPIGLFVAKLRRDPALLDENRYGMDVGFIAMLFLTGLTGMLLLILRETAAMGPLLALHLGAVFALFITMPYGKFVHGIYRFVALVRYAQERRTAV